MDGDPASNALSRIERALARIEAAARAPAAAADAAELAALRVRHERLRAAVQADNGPSLAVVRLLGMKPMGEGRIWCPARGREETCLWFERSRDRARLGETVDTNALP